MFKNKAYIILFLILIVAFVFRIYKIGEVPPSLNWDEVSHGYNAYSILKTGKDEWGFKLPLIFRAYGDFKLPLYIYLTTVSEFFLGLNSYSVRFVSVLSGIGLVFLSFLITKQITKEDKYSLFAAFLTAISPWSLFLSRVAVEANLGAFLFALGMFFLIKWLGKPSSKYLFFAAVSWGLSFHAYNSARILVPVFSLIFFVFALGKKQLTKTIIFYLVLLIFFLPIIFQLLNRSANARFGLVSLVDQGTVSNIIKKREDSSFPKPLPQIIFNRPTFFVYYATINYLKNFSPVYLFFRGGSHYQFSLPGHELLYLVTAPFLLSGLIKVFVRSTKEEKFLGAWMLLSFIPSAITQDAPHVLRSIFILPVPMVLSAFGLKYISDFLREHKSVFRGGLLLAVLVVAILVSFSKWWGDYLSIYPKSYSWSWQYGYKEMISFVRENYEKYDQIFITKRYGEPHEFILFYYPWSPRKYQEDRSKIWDYHANWYWVDGFDKFIFVNDWEVKNSAKCPYRVNKVPLQGKQSAKCLLITSPGNYSEGWSKIKTISFLDGKPSFEILEKEPRIMNNER